MFEFIIGSHQFLGNHTFAEFLVGYIFGAALIVGAPTVFSWRSVQPIQVQMSSNEFK